MLSSNTQRHKLFSIVTEPRVGVYVCTSPRALVLQWEPILKHQIQEAHSAGGEILRQACACFFPEDLVHG